MPTPPGAISAYCGLPLKAPLPEQLLHRRLALFGHTSAHDRLDTVSQFQRALGALGINHRVAPSPQAKGKIERLSGTLQRWLVSLFAFEKIEHHDQCTVAGGNRPLQQVASACDHRLKPRHAWQKALEEKRSMLKPVPPASLLNLHLALHIPRRVSSTSTVEFLGRTWRSSPTNQKTVIIVHHPGHRFWLVPQTDDLSNGPRFSARSPLKPHYQFDPTSIPLLNRRAQNFENFFDLTGLRRHARMRGSPVNLYHQTILIVEDENSDAFLIEQAFRHNGVTSPIHVVGSGSEAIAYFMGEGKYSDRTKFAFPTFIITDIKMFPGDGFEVLHHLNTNPEWRVIPTIVLTSSIDPDDINKAYLLGATSFQQKPNSFECLCQQLRILHDYWMMCLIPEVDETGRHLRTNSRGKLGERFPQPSTGVQTRHPSTPPLP